MSILTTTRRTPATGGALGLLALALSAAAAQAQFAGFAGPAFFAAGGAVTDVVQGDFDNDGDLDVAATLSTIATFDQIAIFLNNGDGTYAAPTFQGVGGTPVSIETADLNKDGRLDLVVANRDSNDVSYLRGLGGGLFAPEVILGAGLGVGTRPLDVAIADFNGDSNLDIAVVNNTSNSVTTIHGDGAGGFSAGTVFATQHPLAPNLGEGPRGISAQDFDRDGDVDIVTGNSIGGNVSVFHNIGSGTFFTGDFAFFIPAADAAELAAADLDHDGDLDLVVGTVSASTRVHILLNDGASPNNSFVLSSSPIVGSRAVDVAIGDINRDGDPDIVAATESTDNIQALLGNGLGGFGAAIPFASGLSPGGIRLGDVDLDGDLDAIVGNLNSSNIAIHYNLESMVGGVPPVASLLDPTPRECIAGIFPVVGVADVPGGVFGSYTLDFQNASTGGAFTTIATSSTAVPAPGGTLGLWDTTLVAEGFYLLRLRVENAMGLDAEQTILVFVSRNFNRVEFFAARGSVPPSPVSIVGGRSCIVGFVNDDNCGPNTYTVDFRPVGGGAFSPVDPSNPVYMGDRLNEVLATWDTIALALPDGDYELRVEGTNGAGQTKVAPIQVITVDNTSPTAIVTAPLNCSRFEAGSLISVEGKIGDANLAGWTLQYSDGDADQWVTIASGNAPLSGVIALWDTTGLRPCAYTLRLIVTDKSSVNCSASHRTDVLTNVLLQCGGDIDGDNTTGPADLLALLASFGRTCPAP